MSVPRKVEFNTLRHLNKRDLLSIVIRMNSILVGYGKRLNHLRMYTERESIDRTEIGVIIETIRSMYLVNLLNPYEGVYESKKTDEILTNLFGDIENLMYTKTEKIEKIIYGYGFEVEDNPWLILDLNQEELNLDNSWIPGPNEHDTAGVERNEEEEDDDFGDEIFVAGGGPGTNNITNVGNLGAELQQLRITNQNQDAIPTGITQEQAARDLAAQDQAAQNQTAQDQAAQDQAARDQAARDQAARDQAAREQAARDQAAQEQAARDQAAQDQAAQNQANQDRIHLQATVDEQQRELNRQRNEIERLQRQRQEQHTAQTRQMINWRQANYEAIRNRSNVRPIITGAANDPPLPPYHPRPAYLPEIPGMPLFTTIGQPRRYKLDSNTPVFSDDKKVSLRDWIFVVEGGFKLGEIPDNIKLEVILPFLKDSPLRTLQRYMKDKGTFANWVEFKKQLKSEFEPHNLQDNLKIKLRNLKQTQSFEKYVFEFKTIVNQIDNISVEDQILWFKEGLQSRIRLEVVNKVCKSLDEAIVYATNAETCLANTVNINYSRIKTHNPKIRNSTSQLKCYRCGKIGHIKRNCYVKTDQKVHKNNTKAFSQKKDRRAQKPKTVAVCNSGLNSILAVSGKINNCGVLFSLDCGAVESIISHRLLSKLNIPLRSSTKRIKTASNEVFAVIGETDPLRISIGDSYSILPFLVIEMDDHEVLLGLDWFNDTKAGIVPVDRVLHINGREIKLCTLDSSSDESDPEDTSVYVSDVVPDEVTGISESEGWELVTPLVKTAVELDRDEVKEFEKIKVEIEKVAAREIDDLGHCKIRKHKIVLIDDQPIFCAPYRKSLAERIEIKKEIDLLLKAGIIRPSNSPWSSPVLMVPKPNGTKRLCVDYRKLNRVTKLSNWPMPRILDILDKLSGSVWFTTLDLKSGYWQVELDRESIELTAFSTPDGHYEFLRLPFGLKNAPSEFSRIMFMVFGSCSFVEIYLDDITIHSKTFKEHLNHIAIVIQKLKKAGLKLNLDKCVWLAKEIKILGHMVSHGTVKMDESKFEAVKSREPPKTVKQLQQFLGLCNYYRRFIKDFAKIVAPMYQLLKKENKWNWSSECQKSFIEIKNLLVSSPVLRLPNFGKPFTVFTDASGYALGAILAQLDDDNNEFVCAYASRSLRGAELHYAITEKECLAVVWAIKHFHVYLNGTQFKVVTDHSALHWLMNLRDPTARLVRWAIYLQAYDFEVIHRKGRVHSNVDCLSRPVLSTQVVEPNENEDTSLKGNDPWEDEPLLYYLKNKKFLAGSSKKQIKRVGSKATKFELENDVLHYKFKNSWLEWPKAEKRRELIHDAHIVGHFQAVSTFKRLNEKYFWAKMMDDVIEFVKECLVCQRHQKTRVKNHNANTIEVDQLFDRIGIDCVFGFPESEEGYTGIVVITEYLSKCVFAEPIRSKEAAEIERFLWRYVTLFGPPKIILSDQGKEFVNSLVNSMLKNVGTEHRVTSAYNPRTNGQTERSNQTICEVLRKHVENEPIKWARWLPFVIMAYNTRVHSSTGFTPYELIFGKKMNSFESWTADDENRVSSAIIDRAKVLENLNQDTRERALINNNLSHRNQRAVQDSRNIIMNERVPVGTKVFLKNEGLIGKLEPRFKGPFEIARCNPSGNYELYDVDRNLLPMAFPLHKLKIVKDPSTATTESWEVEKILSHREINGIVEYLVRWKDCEPSEDTWLKKEHFNSIDLIREFHSNNKIKNKRGRPKKNVNEEKNEKQNQKEKEKKRIQPQRTVKSNFLLTLLVLTFLCFKYTFCFTINGTFQFCDPIGSLKTVLDIENSCSLRLKTPHVLDKTSYEFKQGKNHSLHILVKSKQSIFGKAIQCKEKITVYEYSRTFPFFFQSVDKRIVEEYYTKLKKEDCEYMQKTKRCGDGTMSCDSDGCSGEHLPIDQSTQNFWGSIHKKGYTCSIKYRVINAENGQSKIFSSVSHPCRVGDYECQMSDSIIIWDDSVFHKCPFELVDSYKKFETVQTNLISSDTFLFQITDHVRPCGYSMFKTAEGFYVTEYGDALKLPKAKNVEIEALFTIAENDYTTYSFAKQIIDLDKRLCANMLSTISVMKQVNNGYFKIFDMKGNELVLFSSDGIVYVPQCTKIFSINITDTKNCYEDIPITFAFKDKVVNGFLLRDKIVSRISKVQDCDKVKDVEFIFESILVTKTKNTTTYNYLKYINIRKEVLSRYQYNLSKMNFVHSNHILEGSDIIAVVHDLTSIDETSGTRLSTDPLASDDITTLTKSFSFLNFDYNSLKIMFFVITGILFLPFSILIILFFSSISKFISKKETKTNKNEDIELYLTPRIRETNQPIIVPDFIDLKETKIITNKKGKATCIKASTP